MINLTHKIHSYLDKNIEMLDKLYLIRWKLWFVKITNDRSNKHLDSIIEEIKYIIKELLSDRDNILEICDFLKLLQKTHQTDQLYEISKYLRFYLDALNQGLVVIEGYCEYIQNALKDSKIRSYSTEFCKVSEKRKDIDNKKLILVYTNKKGGRKNGL